MSGTGLVAHRRLRSTLRLGYREKRWTEQHEQKHKWITPVLCDERGVHLSPQRSQSRPRNRRSQRWQDQRSSRRLGSRVVVRSERGATTQKKKQTKEQHTTFPTPIYPHSNCIRSQGVPPTVLIPFFPDQFASRMAWEEQLLAARRARRGGDAPGRGHRSTASALGTLDGWKSAGLLQLTNATKSS